jgi:hypothetical protein
MFWSPILGVERAQKGKKRRADEADVGAQYRSKRAKGDVKKKGTKFEPYAYVKLDKKQINKRYKWLLGILVPMLATTFWGPRLAF